MPEHTSNADVPGPAVDHAATDRKLKDRSEYPTDRETLDLVAQVLDLLPDFFYVHDYEMRFWYANKRAAEYFGFANKEELIGLRLEDVDRRREQARFFADVCRQVMRDGTPRLTDELPYVRPDGTPGLLRQHDIPFRDPKSGEMMLMGLSRDITSEHDLAVQRLRAAQMDRELSIATQIQQAFTPDCGSGIESVQVSAWSRPALYAGGDFYDWGPGFNRNFVFGMGDATGHGVGPALIASACRAYARVLCGLLPTSEVLEQLNGQMCFDLCDGRFVTSIVGSVDPASFAFTLASAGHGPTFVLSADGRATEVNGHAPPLGLSTDIRLEPPTTGTLQPGDAIIMLSDGVFESPGESGAPVGLPTLRSWVKELAGQPAQKVVETLSSRFLSHLGRADLRDDATIVCVSRDR